MDIDMLKGKLHLKIALGHLMYVVGIKHSYISSFMMINWKVC